MAEETQVSHAERGPRKRKIGKKKGSKAKKKLRVGEMKPKKIDRKMKKLFQKRARQYNSDEDSAPEGEAEYELEPQIEEEEQDGENSSEEAGEDENQELGDANVDDESSEYHEDGTIQPGIMNFTESCRAFKMAFKSIFKKTVHDDDTLGPVLAAHKKLVIEKLADEVEDRKAKGVARKEKHLVAEKGHVMPETYLDLHEKFLIGVATKGVVKLFNAVNKAQNAQKGLNPSRSKDAKVLTKKRKQAFFSELGKTSTASTSASKSSNSQGDGEAPGWAPLRDNYMLSNSKLKDWDKMPEPAVTDDIGRGSGDVSSDDDD